MQCFQKYIFLLLISTIVLPLYANDLSVVYSESRADVKLFIDELVSEKIYEKQTLVDILSHAKKIEKTLKLISNPPEKKFEWKDYRKIFLNEKRINLGVDYWQTHQKIITYIEQKYGVPASIIIAIIGIETYYGKRQGGFKVLDVLSTLGFDYPKRSRFFIKELKHFLILAKEQNFDIETLTGSYAGAMGIGQFMPSSYRHYAIDFDKNGQADIWKNDADAIASVANYLNKNGWLAQKPILSKAQVRGSRFKEVVSDSSKPNNTLHLLKKYGWTPKDKKIPMFSKATALTFIGDKGVEYWLGFENFRVITTYNRSNLYAMAVVELAQTIHRRYKKILNKNNK